MDPPATFQLSNLSPEQANIAVAVAISVGTLYCFLGYRTLKFVLGLTGFLLAGSVATTIAGWISEQHVLAMTIVGILGGIAGAFALFFLYRTGIFFLGLLGTTLIAHNAFVGRPEAWIPLAVLGIGILGGLIALLVERPTVTMATAALGSWMMVAGVAYFVHGSDEIDEWLRSFEMSKNQGLIISCWAVLALGGTIAQFATHRSGKRADGD